MGLQKLRTLNPDSRENVCFTLVRGSTYIQREIDENTFLQGKFVVETSLGIVSIVLGNPERHHVKEGFIWVPGEIEGWWTMREYYRILTELVEKFNFVCISNLFWDMPEWFKGWEQEGIIDPEQ
ncbi:MAG: hypothetical protein WC794_00915 [Candidatus Doudnabacteria bacterium]|jgi:hypothetical protein